MPAPTGITRTTTAWCRWVVAWPARCIPEELEGCHTSFIGSYVVDGHVPVKTIRKLLDEKPAIAGITLPGMPAGSPGMFGEKSGPLTIYAVSRDGTAPRVFDVD